MYVLLQFKNFSGNNTIPEYKVQEVTHSRLILLHYGIFKIVWDWLILVCMFYIALMVPFNAVFVEEETEAGRRATQYTDVTVDVLFIIGRIVTKSMGISAERVYSAHSSKQMASGDLFRFICMI